MKSSRSGGFEQAYNAQVAVDQDSFFIVACSLSNHPNDKAEAEPTVGGSASRPGHTRSRGAGQRLLERAEQDCLGRASD